MKDTVDSAKAAPRQSANPTDARETLSTFWNARYAADEFAYGTAPNEFLVQMAPNFARQGRLEPFGASRQALHFGQQKINLHERGREFEPKAHLPVPGALDLCFIVGQPFEAVIAHVRACGWPIVEGPVERTGATGRLRSIYLRDPDLNLLELSELLSPLSD